MIPKNTAKVISFLLRNLAKVGYNINQVANSIRISVGSAFKILKALEKDNLLAAQAIGNAIYYSLNLENQEAVKLCELLLLEEKRQLAGYAKLYADSLQAFGGAELIVLFGSVLAKKEFNDVDALFVTGKVKETASFCLQLSKLRSKPVVPLILGKEDLVNEIRAGKEAVLDIIRKGVVLKGEPVFVEAIKNAKK